MSLENHNVIVTGAGQGIGEAVARLVVDLGGKAILVDLQEDKVNAIANDLGSDNAEVYVGSVAEPGFVQDMVEKAVARNGAIHGLVNNAGIVRVGGVLLFASRGSAYVSTRTGWRYKPGVYRQYFVRCRPPWYNWAN